MHQCGDKPCCGGKKEPIVTAKSVSGLYTCPMHQEIVQDHPGLCPICGMALEPKEGGESDGAEYRDMLRRFWIALALALPILLLSMGEMAGLNLGFSEESSNWIQFLLCTPIVLWAGWPFFKRGWLSLVNRSLNMFTLIALGIGAAYLYSAAAVLFPNAFPDSFKEHGKLFIYFEAAAVITTLVLLGQVMELKAKGKTSQAIQALLERAAKEAVVVANGKEKVVPLDEVKVGDILRVKPGDKVPVDGEIVEGSSYVDESMMTGESIPVQKVPGNEVAGGTINQTGTFLMVAKKVGDETLLARIIQMVSEAQRSKAPIQGLADTVSAYFVPAVVLTALLTFFLWSLFGTEPRLVYALVNAVAVLIIACPCALGLATPMSIMVGVGRGAEMGILIKNGGVLETLEKVDAIAFDKTGTLTEGKPKVTSLYLGPEFNEEELLRLAASLEQASEHPLGAAIVNEANRRRVPLSKADQFQAYPGGGVAGLVDGKKVLVGNTRFLEENQIERFQGLLHQSKKAQEEGQTIAFVAVDGIEKGFFGIADPMKKNTQKAIEDLHQMGIKIVMLTGDNETTARAIARKLGIDEVYAGVVPREKLAIVNKLKDEKLVVAMAGDGVNDSPALAAADVGIAMGTGTDAAIESAGVTLVKGDLAGLVKAVKLSRTTMKNIRQNLFFAFIYNLLGVPIAAGILYPSLGVLLNPMIASGAMSLSSVSVIANALRIKRKI